MKSIVVFLSLIIIVALSSCSLTTTYIQSDKQYTISKPENILIYSGEPKQPYEVIGNIAILVNSNNLQKTADKLKKEASKIGADAVIFLKLELTSSQSHNTGMSGIAIKFKK